MKLFLNWKPFEIAWLGTFTAVGVILTFLWGSDPVSFIAFLTGILCVVLTAKGKLSAYVYGMVNTLLYAYVAFSNNLFGEMGLNLFFFAPANVMGFLMWRRHMNPAGNLVMRKLKHRGNLLVLFLCLAGSWGMGFGLSLIPQQNTPYIDAATNVLSIIATVLMVYRYREQWLLYIVLNVLTILMWSIRTVNGSPEGPLMIVMWSAYLVNACYGFYNWSKGAAQSEAEIRGEA